MRLITGKVLMDRHAPEALRDDVPQAERDCIDLVERWHGKGRLAYAVTVRFAPSSTPEQLEMAGRLCAAIPGVYMQTHVAETREEVALARKLFPHARSYLDVYARAGLVYARSILAHGIWLDDEDRALLRGYRRADRAQSLLQPVPRQRPLRLVRRRWMRGSRCRWQAMSAAAPACRWCAPWPTRIACRRWRDEA